MSSLHPSISQRDNIFYLYWLCVLLILQQGRSTRSEEQIAKVRQFTSSMIPSPFAINFRTDMIIIWFKNIDRSEKGNLWNSNARSFGKTHIYSRCINLAVQWYHGVSLYYFHLAFPSLFFIGSLFVLKLLLNFWKFISYQIHRFW